MAFELLDNEKVIETKHRHWFKLFEDLIALAAGLIAILAIPFAAAVYAQDFFRTYSPEILLAVGLSLQILVTSAFLVVVDYFLDVWVVTDKRLVFIELNGLFSRSSSSVRYRNIQDVSVEVRGILPTLLNYGDLQVQTAGEFKKFIFKNVPSPYELKDKILTLQSEQTKN